jgi:hypothetical protein
LHLHLAEIDLTGLAKLIEETFDQVSYGITSEDIKDLLPDETTSIPSEIPTGLRLTRWEAKDLGLIPQKEGAAGKGRMGLRDLFEDRRTKRSEVKKTVLDMLKALEKTELKDLLGVDAVAKDVATDIKDKKKAKVVEVEAEVVEIDGEGEASADVDMDTVEVVVVVEKKKTTRKPKEEVRSHSSLVLS